MKSLIIVVGIIASAMTFAVSTTGATSSGSDGVPAKIEVVAKKAKKAMCLDARRALTYYRMKRHKWMTLRGVKNKLELAQPKGCAQVRLKVKKAQANAKLERLRYTRWVTSTYTLRERQRWLDAVEEAQKAYPGTAWWLKACSADEGGWGRWVPNSQGSGAGGWLQFMHGTFVGFNRHALDDVKKRGFYHPESARSWYSPLGQALAGAWGYKNGYSYHWEGSGC